MNLIHEIENKFLRTSKKIGTALLVTVSEASQALNSSFSL